MGIHCSLGCISVTGLIVELAWYGDPLQCRVCRCDWSDSGVGTVWGSTLVQGVICLTVELACCWDPL